MVASAKYEIVGWIFYLSGEPTAHACWKCGQNSDFVLSDKLTGEYFFTCKEHVPEGTDDCLDKAIEAATSRFRRFKERRAEELDSIQEKLPRKKRR